MQGNAKAYALWPGVAMVVSGGVLLGGFYLIQSAQAERIGAEVRRAVEESRVPAPTPEEIASAVARVMERHEKRRDPSEAKVRTSQLPYQSEELGPNRHGSQRRIWFTDLSPLPPERIHGAIQ
ncbi:MAG TPA: hypothetical protein VIL46_10305 [Gemmataceae bacterium]